MRSGRASILCEPFATQRDGESIGRKGLVLVSSLYAQQDINTTRIYLRLTSEDVMREVAKIQF